MNLGKIADDYIDSVCGKIRSPKAREEFREELSDRIEQSVSRLVWEGRSPEEAETETVARMGPAPDVSRGLNRIYHPLGETIAKYVCLAFTVFLGYLLLAPFIAEMFSLAPLPVAELFCSVQTTAPGEGTMAAGAEWLLFCFLFPVVAGLTAYLFMRPGLRRKNA